MFHFPQIWGRIFVFLSCPLGPKGTAHIWDRILLDLLLTPQQLAWQLTRAGALAVRLALMLLLLARG